jgi:PTS system nitrogen regulatory IIA component
MAPGRDRCNWVDDSMDLSDLLAPEGILPALNVTCKKQALQELAARAADVTRLDERQLFETMLQRERLGSTGLGRGIAIPHVKAKNLESIVCLFARLSTPIDFESQDGEPVDLIFLLLAPERASGDHLKALARISRLVREPSTLEQLRHANDAAALRKVLTAPVTSHAA